MSKILLVTVGGSPQPIMTAISTLEPEQIVFICSDGSKGSKFQIIGEGTPCEIRRGAEVVERLPNLPAQLGLGDRFQPARDLVLIQNPDELSECYRLVSEKIRLLRHGSIGNQIMVDYTGGTKTMSVGLALAALDYELPVFLTTNATRQNLIKVEWGESTERASSSLIVVQRTIEQFLPSFLKQYNYPAAVAELKRILLSMELQPDLKQRVRDLQACCAGFDAWDRFDHATAWQMLQPYMKQREIQPLGMFLKRVMSSREAIDERFTAIDGSKGHGYEIVEDLLLNAERRVTQERYDDAVGRLYRAIELLVQIRLQQTYDIKTGDVEVQKLPESMREKYESMRSPTNGKIQLALRSSYELLSLLPDDPLGQLYQERANRIINVLEIRNNSLFAHGFQPINTSSYKQLSEVFVPFIETGISTIVPPKSKSHPVQFPPALDI